MAVRGAAASRRRLRRRVALVCGVVALVVGVVGSLTGGGGAGDALFTGVFLGCLAALVGYVIVALLPTSHHGPPGQH
ncbi:hypothetical protein [Cellulomonas rhizosphaerae]|uniref:Uncharacterized protein n=1 Tax=Cellulomonas rhizosphaerae TaxID=2293719 RepID=A0A413RKC9_9CELL|nr:hypothetical protein [Cellulomonas rhizosphaerae]RHA39388.1 hypothetical protein D1825_12040 [Cellulomonas rhizosphaerae]